ncbi:Uncharacterised protein [Mesomycoplasma conjunctivae]|uniref:Uncharacterized protein n=1 Tax=Mesomycoplasma conjunctivae (strain ATCC 25834 / NCTC 10147 / HRC/581) TaxID=572263 RepID=C5J6E2_MESCH|nr:hypothetical protein [Mesomycoplasma conjunctivae]CAT05034.1 HYPOTHETICAL PROTEIN MCJ_003450 [Mesomycoplasma conjunctivae]VEU66308.1 Uncharacterised protein [Mesomycoplasma conjunctivae]
MNKKRKIFLPLVLVTSPILLPTLFISQSPTTNTGTQNNNANSANTQNQSSNPDSPKPINQQELEQNKAFWEKNRLTYISRFIEKVKKDIDVKLEDIKSKTRDNLEERLSQSFFWLQLKHYFISNETAIQNDPVSLGLNLLTPYIFSNNINLKKGDVKFGDQDFSGIEWATSTNSDYSKLNNVSITKSEDSFNTLKGEDLKKRLDTYFQGLESGYKQYLFKEDEFPKYKENFTLNLDQSGASVDLVLTSPPKGKEGISSWDQWIKNYFSQQSLLLDLSLNQLPNPTSQQSPQQQIDLAIRQLNQANPPDVSQKPEFEIRIAPDLPPILNPNWIGLSNSDIIASFNSEDKENVFFFLNPINSRFKYNVTELSQVGNDLEATVQIEDFVAKSRSGANQSSYQKSYKSKIYNDFPTNASDELKSAITTNLFYSNQGVANIIDQFFSTINVKGDFSLDQIKYFAPGSQNLIYNFFFLITKVFYNKDFLDAQKQLAQNYIGSAKEKVYQASEYQFIEYLKKSEIDNNKAWDYYYLIYLINLTFLQSALNPADQGEQAESQSEQIANTLLQLNTSKEELDKIFNQSRQNSLLFHQLSYRNYPNVKKQFDAMVELAKKLNMESQILGQVAFINKDGGQANGQNAETQDNKVANFSSIIEEYRQGQKQDQIKNFSLYFGLAILLLVLNAILVSILKIFYKKGKRSK